MAAQVTTASARTKPVVSATRRITSTAVWTILATRGPILTAISAAPTMTATATMPALWPSELLQHDGLHMTGRLAVGSVKHATHLFLVWLRMGFWWLAGPEEC